MSRGDKKKNHLLNKYLSNIQKIIKASPILKKNTKISNLKFDSAP
jgi:hypothetical protein